MSVKTASFWPQRDPADPCRQGGTLVGTITVQIQSRFGVMLALRRTILGDRHQPQGGARVSELAAAGLGERALTSEAVVHRCAITTRKASTTIEMAAGKVLHRRLA